MSKLSFGKKKGPQLDIKLNQASLEEILTKGMGRDYIPSAEKQVIKDAIAKTKGASAATSYFQREKPVKRLKEVMKTLEKEGVFKEYEGRKILNEYKRKWEIRKKNIQRMILDDVKKGRAKETLMSGEKIPEIEQRALKRILGPQEIRKIESEMGRKISSSEMKKISKFKTKQVEKETAINKVLSTSTGAGIGKKLPEKPMPTTGPTFKGPSIPLSG